MKKESNIIRKKTPLSTVQPSKIIKKTRLEIAWEWLSKQNYKLWFWVSLAVCSMLTMYWASKAGVHGDAPLDYEYGVQCANYYLSGGKDTSCLSFTWKNVENRVTQKYYGGGFETTFALLQLWFNWDDYYQVRLYYLSLWCIVLLLFISLIAKEFTGWKGAMLALWLTFLSPFILGQFFWNTKDIPHALGFAITIFFLLRFYKMLPKISFKVLLGIALGIVIALSVRLGGLLLIAYVGLFSLLACFMLPQARSLFVNKQYGQVLKIIVSLIATVITGALLGLLFYPNFFVEGFNHILSGINVATNFPQKIPFIFEGVMTDSLKKPPYYLLKMFYIQTPMVVLIMLHLAILVILWKWKKTGALNMVILLFTLLFPFIYMIKIGAPAYNSWRHILFAGVTISPIITIMYKELLATWRSSLIKWVSLIIILASLVDLAIWNVRAAPYQLGFYNCTVGGTKGAYKKYDFDQWHIAVGEGTKWILNTVNPDDYSPEHPLVIAMNCQVVSKVYHIPEKWRGKLQLENIAFRNYSGKTCDYTVLTPFFASPQVLSYFYPPKGVVYKRVVDDVVAMCVIDRRNDTDYRGIKALQNNELEDGLKLLEEAYDYNPKNYSMFYWLGYGYYRTGNFEKAIEFLNSYKKFYNEKDVNRLLGYAHYSNRQYNEAINAFNISFSMDQNDLTIAQMIGICFYEKKDYDQAEKFLKQVIAKHPSFTEGKTLLQHIQQIK